MSAQSNPIALVTGASRGIGLSLTRQLHERGHTVIAASPTTSPELEALGVRFEPVDVANGDSIAALTHRLNGTEFNLLITTQAFCARVPSTCSTPRASSSSSR